MKGEPRDAGPIEVFIDRKEVAADLARTRGDAAKDRDRRASRMELAKHGQRSGGRHPERIGEEHDPAGRRTVLGEAEPRANRVGQPTLERAIVEGDPDRARLDTGKAKREHRETRSALDFFVRGDDRGGGGCKKRGGSEGLPEQADRLGEGCRMVEGGEGDHHTPRTETRRMDPFGHLEGRRARIGEAGGGLHGMGSTGGGGGDGRVGGHGRRRRGGSVIMTRCPLDFRRRWPQGVAIPGGLSIIPDSPVVRPRVAVAPE